MRFTIGLGLSVCACGLAWGQSGEDKLSFEVASVKPSGPNSRPYSDGGPGTHDPGRFTATGVPFRSLLFMAYGGSMREQIAGPGWIDAERYDVAVKIPPDTDKQRFQRMFQNLLAERFKLVVHHETKVLPIYELVIAKNGPKLKESVETAEADGPELPPGRLPRDSEGFVILPAGRPNIATSFGVGGSAHLTSRREPISVLARALSSQNAAGRRVIDKTGLTGKYDFKLSYHFQYPGMPANADDDLAPTIEQALQQQLGLKLVDAKAPFDIVVVDSAEKVPTEN